VSFLWGFSILKHCLNYKKTKKKRKMHELFSDCFRKRFKASGMLKTSTASASAGCPRHNCHVVSKGKNCFGYSIFIVGVVTSFGSTSGFFLSLKIYCTLLFIPVVSRRLQTFDLMRSLWV